LSNDSTAVVPVNKRDANAAVREIEQIDRQLAENKARHELALERENEPLLERRAQLAKGLAVYGNAKLPPGVEGGSKTIQLNPKRRIYRRRSTQVVFDVPEKEVVEALKGKKFWFVRFVQVQVKFSVKKEAVAKWPYILKKLPGMMKIRQMDNLYLAKSDPDSKNEVLAEHELLG